MLLCSSRTDEAAPWGFWELSSTKRGWGFLAFPSAVVTALDPVTSSLFAEESWHRLPFIAWYSWIWHHFPIAHGKEKESNDLVVLICFYCGTRIWSVGTVPPLLLFPVFPGTSSWVGDRTLLCVGSVCSPGTCEGQRILVTSSLDAGCTG